jgi:hypothetical protein
VGAEARGVKFATKLRLVLFLSIALMLTPLALLMSGKIGQPPLWEGDRLEQRACPECQGKASGCKSCFGQGKARYILPGPHRPTRFAGLIIDSQKSWLGEPPPAPLPATPGGMGVFPAQVKFITSDGFVVPLETDPRGRFQVELIPGTYQVQASSPGLPAYEGKLEVAPLTEPIRYDGGRGAMYTLPLILDLGEKKS